MKKISLILLLFINSLSLFAQSFSGPSSATTGTEVTLTAVGESYNAGNGSSGPQSPYYYFGNINGIYSTDISFPNGPSNASKYISISLAKVVNLFNPTSQNATVIKVNVSNTLNAPITVTFQITVQYFYHQSGGGSGETGAVLIPFTITITPTASGGTGGGTGGINPGGDTGGTLTNYLWRLRNSNNQHFYTINASELTSATAVGWTYEGTIGYVFKAVQSGTVVLDRLYNSKTGEHFYTIDQNEANGLLHSGFVSEGGSGYVYSSLQSNTKPVYRYLAKSGPGGHFYTSDFSEIGSGNSSWTYEGIAYYILSAPQ